MSKVTKPCRVCGKEFVPCKDCVNDYVAFHWREVACSEECGKEYLRQVMEARNVEPIKTVENIKSDVVEDTQEEKQTQGFISKFIK
jgi:hypothetical protein